MRALFLSTLVAGALAVSAATASAASYDDQFAGIEVPPVSPTVGTFTGVAKGALAGGWYAQIAHDQLSASPASITGGLFTLYAVDGRTITEPVTGGSVSPVNPGTGCTKQTFAVDVELNGDDHAFTGTLTHYRVSIFGRCIIYSASIVGSGTLTTG